MKKVNASSIGIRYGFGGGYTHVHSIRMRTRAHTYIKSTTPAHNGGAAAYTLPQWSMPQKISLLLLDFFLFWLLSLLK